MEIVPYGGWSRCARLVSGSVEAIVTLEVGPRVIRFGFVGEQNLFVEYERHRGLTGGSEYRSYGGHRLWVAPEIPEITYEPDNDPVEVDGTDGWTSFQASVGESGLRRTVMLRPIPGDGFAVRHFVENIGHESLEIAPWAITVMAPGGECLFPQAQPLPHPQALQPARPLALWAYTDMADSRWTWGRSVVRLRQSDDGPQKTGAFVSQGYSVYVNQGLAFIKRFPADVGAVYPDFGCNFEVFTRHDMLEVESLGPLVTLGPGRSISHDEAWYVARAGNPPAEDRECLAWLQNLISIRPLP